VIKISKVVFYFALLSWAFISAISSEISGGGLYGVNTSESEFYGFGTKNSKYLIKAVESTQLNPNTHSLIKIEGIYTDLDKKDGFRLVSDKGIYNSSHKTLDLLEDIEVDFDLGYKMIVEKMTINFDQKIIYSKYNTEITGANETTISKSGFTHNMKDQIIYFPGPVTTILVRK